MATMMSQTPRMPCSCSHLITPRPSRSTPRVGEVSADRLLQVDMPAVAEHLDDTVSLQLDRQQRFDRVDLDATGRQLGRGREGLGGRPVRLALVPALGDWVNERDDLDVGGADVAAHVEVVDAAQAYV